MVLQQYTAAVLMVLHSNTAVQVYIQVVQAARKYTSLQRSINTALYTLYAYNSSLYVYTSETIYGVFLLNVFNTGTMSYRAIVLLLLPLAQG